MFEYLTDEDWNNLQNNYPDCINHMQRLSNQREMEYLKKRIDSGIYIIWEKNRLQEMILALNIQDQWHEKYYKEENHVCTTNNSSRY